MDSDVKNKKKTKKNRNKKNPVRWVINGIRNGIAKIFRGFKPSPSYRDEMELITNDLIADTVGPRGVITMEFQKRASLYDPDVNPIGEKEARELMFSLIRIAVSRRKLMNERVANSVEYGGFYQRYFGKLHKIGEISAKTLVEYYRTEDAFDDYEEQRVLLEEVKKYANIDKVDTSNKPRKRWNPSRTRNKIYGGKESVGDENDQS